MKKEWKRYMGRGMEVPKFVPVYSYLGVYRVITVGITPKRFRIRAIERTKVGRRWLEAGEEALVKKSELRHGEYSKAVSKDEYSEQSI
jgi:hypothetical protein